MNKPTRKQWRGYAVMCAVLVAALMAFLFWPRIERKPEVADHSQLRQAVESYGEEIVAENARIKTNRYASRHKNSFHYEKREYQRKDRRKDYDDFVIELNGADTSELQLLYGIGPVYANRIVKYRRLLGGFVRKEQLMDVYGMDEERYAGIAGHIVIDTSLVERLRVNEMSVAELKRHPYLDYYQAKAIVEFRNKCKRIESMDDLKLVNLIDNETATNLQGYIQFN